jgi:hypothetical protein
MRGVSRIVLYRLLLLWLGRVCSDDRHMCGRTLLLLLLLLWWDGSVGRRMLLI